MPSGYGPPWPPGVSDDEMKAVTLLLNGHTLAFVASKVFPRIGLSDVPKLMRFLRRMARRIGVSSIDPQRSLVVWRAKQLGALELKAGERGPHGWTLAEEDRFDHEMRHPARQLGPRPKRVKRDEHPATTPISTGPVHTGRL